MAALLLIALRPVFRQRFRARATRSIYFHCVRCQAIIECILVAHSQHGAQKGRTGWAGREERPATDVFRVPRTPPREILPVRATLEPRRKISPRKGRLPAFPVFELVPKENPSGYCLCIPRPTRPVSQCARCARHRAVSCVGSRLDELRERLARHDLRAIGPVAGKHVWLRGENDPGHAKPLAS